MRTGEEWAGIGKRETGGKGETSRDGYGCVLGRKDRVGIGVRGNGYRQVC